MVRTRARVAERRSLSNLFAVLPQQLVQDVLSYASDKGPRLFMCGQNFIGEAMQDCDDSLSVHNFMCGHFDDGGLDALLVVAGMAQLRAVSKAFHAAVDDIADREHFASVGFRPAEATTSVMSVKDYVWENFDWILRTFSKPRAGEPRSTSEVAAIANDIRAAVAADDDDRYYDDRKFDAWYDGCAELDASAVGGFPFLEKGEEDPWAFRTQTRNSIRILRRLRAPGGAKRVPCMTSRKHAPGLRPRAAYSSRSGMWRAVADRAHAIVAHRSGMMVYGTDYFDELSVWRGDARDLADRLSERFLRRASSMPWSIDAWHVSIVCDGELSFDASHPRCSAFREFALSLVPPESAGEISELPSSEQTRRIDLFGTPLVQLGTELDGFRTHGSRMHSGDYPDRVIEAFCAFSFRPEHRDVSNHESPATQHSSSPFGVLSPFVWRRGGYAVRAADFREPDAGCEDDVQGWKIHWAEDDDEWNADQDYNPFTPDGDRSQVQYWRKGYVPADEKHDFESDNDEDYVDYSSFLADYPSAPIVLDKVKFDFRDGTVELRFQFADAVVNVARQRLQLRVAGTIPLMYSRARRSRSY